MSKIINVALIGANAETTKNFCELVNKLYGFSECESENKSLNKNIIDNEFYAPLKICAIYFKKIKINLINIPLNLSSRPFVERISNIVDSMIFFVDSNADSYSKTRFSLWTILAKGVNAITVINDSCLKNNKVESVINEIDNFFQNLEATTKQISTAPILMSFPVSFNQQNILNDLFDCIIELSSNKKSTISTADLLLQVIFVGYDANNRKFGIGRVTNGKLTNNQEVLIQKNNSEKQIGKIGNLKIFKDFNIVCEQEVLKDEIAIFSGISNICIGDVINNIDKPIGILPIHITQPNLSIKFFVNNSPLAKKYNRFSKFSDIQKRLGKEVEINPEIKILPLSKNANIPHLEVLSYNEIHIYSLIKRMQKEGYEFAVGKPSVVYKKSDDELYHPALETLQSVLINSPLKYRGVIISTLKKIGIENPNIESYCTTDKITFLAATSRLINLEMKIVEYTNNSAFVIRSFEGYKLFSFPKRIFKIGSIVSTSTGFPSISALLHMQSFGVLFITPNTEVYEGMIIGYHYLSDEDLEMDPISERVYPIMNTLKTDESNKNINLMPTKSLSLEEAILNLKYYELIEIMPNSLRLRKWWLTSKEREEMAMRP